MEQTYFDLLPIDITSYIQTFIHRNDLYSWCTLIKYCEDKNYWSYFYSHLSKNWKLIIDNKPNNESYLYQYLYLLNSDDIIKETEKNRLDSIVYLVSKGKEIDKQNNIGDTALMKASNSGNLEIVKYLVSNGAEINKQDKYGFTALMMASRKGRLEIVKYLVSKGAEIDKQNNYGFTALIWASSYGELEIVKYLESFNEK